MGQLQLFYPAFTKKEVSLSTSLERFYPNVRIRCLPGQLLRSLPRSGLGYPFVTIIAAFFADLRSFSQVLLGLRRGYSNRLWS
jgi:hypothetical protein